MLGADTSTGDLADRIAHPARNQDVVGTAEAPMDLGLNTQRIGGRVTHAFNLPQDVTEYVPSEEVLPGRP